MSGIQLILLTGVIFIGLYFVVRLRKRLLDVILLSILGIVACLFILFPDITNRIAAYLNVGRGADLIFYVSILLFWFVILKLYIKVRSLEKAFTDLVRQDALKNAESLPPEEHQRP